ncbi:hypothetical protein TNCV_3278251 [Trichonephila clavipes]|nr:hypothetical protein TNCV_3278251 [Trichonephila clavipes]
MLLIWTVKAVKALIIPCKDWVIRFLPSSRLGHDNGKPHGNGISKCLSTFLEIFYSFTDQLRKAATGQSGLEKVFDHAEQRLTPSNALRPLPLMTIRTWLPCTPDRPTLMTDTNKP